MAKAPNKIRELKRPVKAQTVKPVLSATPKYMDEVKTAPLPTVLPKIQPLSFDDNIKFVRQRTVDAIAVMSRYKDPIEALCEIAQNVNFPIEIRVKCYCELASFKYPKRKAIELSAPPPPPQEVLVTIVDQATST